jgi:hypothetical protein
MIPERSRCLAELLLVAKEKESYEIKNESVLKQPTKEKAGQSVEGPMVSLPPYSVMNNFANGGTDPDMPEDSAETPNANVTVDEDNVTPLPQDVPTINEPLVSTSNTTFKRGPRSGAKRGRGGRAGLSSRDEAGSPASGTKNGKEASASPGLGSGADSSGTGAGPAPSRRGRPGHGLNGGSGGSGSGGTTREPTMTELKKRASLMLDIIAQSQLEMARAEPRRFVKGKTSLENVDDLAPAASLAGELATRLVKWQHEFTLEAAAMADSGSAKG